MHWMSKSKCACVQLKSLTLLYANVIWTSPLQVFPLVRADHLKSGFEPCRGLSGSHCAAAAAAEFSHSVTVSLPLSPWMLWPIFCVRLLLGFSCMLREFVSFLFLFCAINMWRHAQWKPFISLQEHILPKPRAYYRVEQSAEPDVWLDAVQVWEVKCADLSLSPVYKAAMGMVSPAC